jgi:uncharacterized protein (TIGR02145 family)
MNSIRVISLIGPVIIFLSINGCKKTEPENVLEVTTDEIEEFSEGIYTVKGNIVVKGKEEINMHGFYWSESENPETDGEQIQLGSRNSTGSFSSTVYDVLPGKTYYVRAFATTGSFKCYGDVKSFSTPVNMVLPVFDIDRNIYYPVKIGDQTWMSSNLKVIHYPDGSLIPHVENQREWYLFSMYTRAFCWYENIGIYAELYGGLYTWPAAMNINSESEIRPGNVQGVCPDGWHLPSDSEWKKLEMNLGMSQEAADRENWRGDNEGDKLKNGGIQNWINSISNVTNGSWFGAVPAGWRNGAGYFQNLGKSARFWTSSKRNDYAWMRELDYNSSQILRSPEGLYVGISVRCIKDTP